MVFDGAFLFFAIRSLQLVVLMYTQDALNHSAEVIK
jgi:hypothetical protein